MFYRYYFKLRGLEVNLAFCLFSFLQEVVGIVGTVLILTALSTRLKRSSFICCQDWGRLVFTCSTRGRTIRSWVHVTSVLWLGIRLNTCLPHLSIRSFVKHGAKKTHDESCTWQKRGQNQVQDDYQVSRDAYWNHDWLMLKVDFAPQIIVKHIEFITVYRYRDVRFVTLVCTINVSCVVKKLWYDYVEVHSFQNGNIIENRNIFVMK